MGELGGRPDWVKSETIADSVSPFCCRRSLWCVLDTVLHCNVRWICDRHDRVITGFYIHCGDDTCTDDHG